MQEKSETPVGCVFCGNSRVMLRRCVAAGLEWPVCYRCDAVVAQLRREGVWPKVEHCLALARGEVEHVADVGRLRTDAEARHVRDLRRKIMDGTGRDHCPCEVCQSLRTAERSFRPVGQVLAKRRREDGPLDVSKLSLSTLATLPPDMLVFDQPGEVFTVEAMRKRRERANREATAYPGMKPGGLAERAYRLVRKPVRSDELTRIKDALSRAYWADWRELGPDNFEVVLRDLARRRPCCWKFEDELHPVGFYYDGPYAVDLETGECFVLPDVALDLGPLQ